MDAAKDLDAVFSGPDAQPAGLLVLHLGGCASATSPGSVNGAPLPAKMTSLVPYEEQHALLLLMADRRLFEPLAVAEAFQGDDSLRIELALVLGRLGDVPLRAAARATAGR